MISSANLPILALNVLALGSYKHQTLNINYTQLTVKVKFFFQKKWLFQKTGCINPFFFNVRRPKDVV